MGKKNNSFWSLKVQTPHHDIRTTIKRHSRRATVIVCLVVAIALTVVSAYVFSDTLKPIPESRFPNWQFSQQIGGSSNQPQLCEGVNQMNGLLNAYEASSQSQGWPLSFFYYQPAMPGNCDGVTGTAYATVLPLLADVAIYFVFVSVAWWEFGRMQRGMSAKP